MVCHRAWSRLHLLWKQYSLLHHLLHHLHSCHRLCSCKHLWVGLQRKREDKEGEKTLARLNFREIIPEQAPWFIRKFCQGLRCSWGCHSSGSHFHPFQQQQLFLGHLLHHLHPHHRLRYCQHLPTGLKRQIKRPQRNKHLWQDNVLQSVPPTF